VKNLSLYVLVALFSFSFWSCKSSSDNISSEITTTQLVETDFKYDTACVVGDTLFARVSYSGGCGTHEFSLESNGVLLKSLPPKQPLSIVHRSDDDPCRALIIENLKFSISSYRGTQSGTTVLLLENWNQHLSYSY